MRSWKLASILALAAAVWLCGEAAAERRTALVIGNGAYRDAPLRNPVNDARDMAEALRRVGFEVILREDADLRQMEQAVDLFWQRLKAGGTGLFFYAGHGVQVSGRNFLVPVDANVSAEQDVKYRCLDAGLVLGRMENAGNGVNIVILDACRNNPFSRSLRSLEAGLARMDAPTGSLIAYSTAPGAVAADGIGRNGVYTKHLLAVLDAPAMPLEEVFRRVRVGVMAETGKRQVPWEATSLTGLFYFVDPGLAVRPEAFEPGPGLDVERERLAGQEQRLAREQREVAERKALEERRQKLAEEEVRLAEERRRLAARAEPVKPPPAPALKTAGARPPARPRPGEVWAEPVTGMEFVFVPGGCFKMGDVFGSGHTSEKPVHEVCLEGFWIGRFEVTQAQWRAVMGNNPSRFGSGERHPVDSLTWEQARDFTRALSAASGGQSAFRLPTEAEWEYACRSGGKNEIYAGGDDASRVAWYDDNAGGGTHAVGQKAPNGLGIFDMSGNVAEWVQDRYSDQAYAQHAKNNPLFAEEGNGPRALRGGSFLDRPISLRSVDHTNLFLRGDDRHGLRVARNR